MGVGISIHEDNKRGTFVDKISERKQTEPSADNAMNM
jgi:hypothetical protein